MPIGASANLRLSIFERWTGILIPGSIDGGLPTIPCEVTINERIFILKKRQKASVAKSKESTVRVFVGGKEAALGVVVSADGWILTKHSVLKGKITLEYLRKHSGLY